LEYEVSSSKGYTSSSLVATEMTDWDYLFGGDYQEDQPSVDEEMYEKLQDLCIEAKLLKDQADDESKIIRKTEMDLHSALQRVRFVL